MTVNTKIASLILFLQCNVDEGRKELKEVANVLKSNDPVGAFSWADPTAAAWVSIAGDLIARVEQLESAGTAEDEILKMLREELAERVLRFSRWPTRSTSPLQNYTSECKLAVNAEILAYLGD